MFDHLVNVDGQGRAVAPHEGHAEGATGGQHLLGLGHQLQGVIVGGEQTPEMQVVVAEGVLKFLGIAMTLGKEPAAEGVDESQHRCDWTPPGKKKVPKV